MKGSIVSCDGLLTIACSEELYEACTPLIGQEVEVSISKPKKGYSMDALRYAWLLTDRIAKELGTGKTDVYRDVLRDLPQCSEMICIRQEAAETFDRCWTEGHLGRFTEVFPSCYDGFVNLAAYYGMRDFDKAMMARYTDYVVILCHDLGIETKPQEEIDSLLDQWKEK